MNPQVTASPAPLASPSPAASAVAAPAASPSPRGNAFSAIPRPSLKPSEVITWVKLDRPRLALGEIIVGSFALAGLVLLISVGAGVLLGHFRSKRTDTHGAGGLRLR